MNNEECDKMLEMLGHDTMSQHLVIAILEEEDYNDPITVFYISSLLPALCSIHSNEYNMIMEKILKSPCTDDNGDILLSKPILDEITQG